MKRLSLCLLLFVFLFGCASLKPERNVVDNTFYSSYPKRLIKISPDYEYVGHLNHSSEGKATNLTYDLRYEYESYIFLKHDNNRVKEAIVVQIEKISTYYVSDIFAGVKNKLESGVCELGGKKYHHYSKAIVPSMKRSMTRFVSDKGFIMPQCTLSKTAGRVEGRKGNILFKVRYFVDVTGLDYTCRDWKDRDTLTNEQRSYLEKFERNWEESFEMQQ